MSSLIVLAYAVRVMPSDHAWIIISWSQLPLALLAHHARGFFQASTLSALLDADDEHELALILYKEKCQVPAKVKKTTQIV